MEKQIREFENFWTKESDMYQFDKFKKLIYEVGHKFYCSGFRRTMNHIMARMCEERKNCKTIDEYFNKFQDIIKELQ